MRFVSLLGTEREMTVMDLSPIAAKAHRLRIQKAAFGNFEVNNIDFNSEPLSGRVTLGKPAQVNDSPESLAP